VFGDSMNYFDAPKGYKPTLQIWRLANGNYWVAFPPHGGCVADTKAEAIARLKSVFPEIKAWRKNDHTEELSHALL
jgi:predicted RNase H-like HicB family nuclease